MDTSYQVPQAASAELGSAEAVDNSDKSDESSFIDSYAHVRNFWTLSRSTACTSKTRVLPSLNIADARPWLPFASDSCFSGLGASSTPLMMGDKRSSTLNVQTNSNKTNCAAAHGLELECIDD